MKYLEIWNILGLLATIALIIFWRRRNAVWGGLFIGIVLGLVIAIIYTIMGNGFNWSIIGKVTVSGTLIGLIAELLGIFSDRLRRV
jgi:MFS superfamily sulfate permease-like transporter